ncbi:MAG: major capsid protein [Rhodocyclaceae bacterium]|nr:major capsid protein [Rhodocyclaceae bacterium]
MPQMTPADARVVDPILSTVAQGYQNSELIFPALFPVVPVGQRGGKIIQFGREDFRLYNTARSPGAATKRIDIGYSGSSFALADYSLEGKVPFELMQESNAVPGVDLGRVAVMKVQNVIQLGNEINAATIATTAASYQAANKATLAGTSQWSEQASGVSNPSKDIQTAIEAVRAAVGKRAQTVVLGPKVWAALKTHPLILDRIKYTGRDSITLEMLANLWDVKRVVVGDAIYEDAAGAIQDVWGKYVVVAYTDISGVNDAGLPSYGYTYRLSDYPLVEVPYQDRNAKSWIYPVTDSLAPVAASINAGYLISAAVA